MSSPFTTVSPSPSSNGSSPTARPSCGSARSGTGRVSDTASRQRAAHNTDSPRSPSLLYSYRRMRPSISRLISPIYPELLDHPSVRGTTGTRLGHRAQQRTAPHTLTHPRPPPPLSRPPAPRRPLLLRLFRVAPPRRRLQRRAALAAQPPRGRRHRPPRRPPRRARVPTRSESRSYRRTSASS